MITPDQIRVVKETEYDGEGNPVESDREKYVASIVLRSVQMVSMIDAREFNEKDMIRHACNHAKHRVFHEMYGDFWGPIHELRAECLRLAPDSIIAKILNEKFEEIIRMLSYEQV